MKPLNSQPAAFLFVAGGAVFISFAAPLVRLAEVSASASAFYRMLFGAAMLLIWTLARSSDRARFWRGWGVSFLVGAFFALDLWLWHRSIHWVGPGIATLLANLQVLVLALAGVILFGERSSWRLFAGIAAALAGLWLLVGVGWETFSPRYRMGIWFGMATALAYAAYILTLRAGQQMQQSISPVQRLFQVSLSCALILLLVNLLEANSLVIPDLPSFGYLLLLALFPQVLGWVAISRGLPLLAASVVGLLLLLQPALAFFWDWLFFHLHVSPLQTVGFLLALVGIYLGSVAARGESRR